MPRTLITAGQKQPGKEGNEKTAEKIASGALKPDLAAVEKAPGIKPLPALCAKGAFERCLTRRFATEEDLVGDLASRLKIPV